MYGENSMEPEITKMLTYPHKFQPLSGILFKFSTVISLCLTGQPAISGGERVNCMSRPSNVRK